MVTRRKGCAKCITSRWHNSRLCNIDARLPLAWLAWLAGRVARGDRVVASWPNGLPFAGGVWLDLRWALAGPLLALSLPLRSQGAGTKGARRPTFALSLHQTSLISLVDPRLAGLAHARAAVRFVVAAAAFASSSSASASPLSLSIFTRPASHIPFGRLTAWPPAHLRLVLAASTNYLADRRSLPSSAPLVYYHAYRFSCTCTLLRQPLRLSPSLFFYRLWTVDTDTTLANGCQPPPSHVRRRPR